MGYFVSPDETRLDTLDGLDDLISRESSEKDKPLEMKLGEIHPDVVYTYPSRKNGKKGLTIMTTEKGPENKPTKVNPSDLPKVLAAGGEFGRLWRDTIANIGGALGSIFSAGESKGGADVDYMIKRCEMLQVKSTQTIFNISRGLGGPALITAKECKSIADDMLKNLKAAKGEV